MRNLYQQKKIRRKVIIDEEYLDKIVTFQLHSCTAWSSDSLPKNLSVYFVYPDSETAAWILQQELHVACEC